MDHILQSSAGVQQGDALGPLLFSLALQPVLKDLRAAPGVDVVFGYLDDVVICGDDSAVRRAVEILDARARQIGLLLNMSKCTLVPPARGNHSCDLTSFDARIKRNTSGCFKLLGAPIGDIDYCRGWICKERIAKLRKLLRAVPDLEDAQIAHKILHQCLGQCRVVYAMRTTRPDWASTAFAEVDADLRQAFEEATGRPWSVQQWNQATLAIKRGGLGLRSAQKHAPAAYLSSRLATRSACRQLDQAYAWTSGNADDWLVRTIETLNQNLAADDQVAPDDLAPEATLLTQKDLSRRLECAQLAELIQHSEPVDKARLRAVSAPHAGGWLQAQPAETFGQRWTHAEFVAGVQIWLGSMVQSADGWCPQCDQVMDSRGHHAFACMAGGDADLCHSDVRDFTYRQATAAGLCPGREDPKLLPDDPRRRPGDLFFSQWPGGGKVALDFAITSPLQLSQVGEAARTQLAAATAYEARKLSDRDTARRCAAHGISLVPMVAESLGGWGPRAQKAINIIARAAAACSGHTVGISTARIYEGLSTRIMRANARSLLARVTRCGNATACAGAAHDRARARLSGWQ